MNTLSSSFTLHHHHIDMSFERLRDAIRAADWWLAQTQFTEFREAIERHMQVEERFLFPAFEARYPDEPLIAILSKGHKDLRSFFDEIEESIQAQDDEEGLDLTGTVRTILTQHDAKEESELYPQIDALLADRRDAVLSALGENEA